MYTISTALIKNNDSALLVRWEKKKCVEEGRTGEEVLTQRKQKGNVYDWEIKE